MAATGLRCEFTQPSLSNVCIYREKSADFPSQILLDRQIKTDLLVGEHDPLGDQGGVLDAHRVRSLPRDVPLPKLDLLQLVRGPCG